ncbi:Kinesin light chain 3 [Rhizophlyctis rosea]|nr:Kinesin light chain 3 [Rhizophlyctis rosea]
MLAADIPNLSQTGPSTSMNLPLLGVPVSFLQVFIAECGGRAKLWSLTTAQVCEQFIIRRTNRSISICDHLLSDPANGITTANLFISHCWQYVFLDTVDAITSYFEGKALSETEPEPIIWIDIFSLPQHGRSKIASDWLQTTFIDAIAHIRNMLMILTPWNQPLTLTRAWCVFELFACVHTKSSFNIALPPSEAPIFRECFASPSNTNAFRQAIASIKSKNSIATEKGDLLSIHGAIRESVGFEMLDRMVSSLLSAWMVSVLEDHVHITSGKEDQEEYAGWLDTLGMLHFSMESFDKAAPLLTTYLEIRQRVLGTDHFDTMKCGANLGVALFNEGDCQRAEPLLLDNLARTRRIFGEEHFTTISVMAQLGYLRLKQLEYKAAGSIFLESLARWKARTERKKAVTVDDESLAIELFEG